jgi:hypothetical protein
MKSGGFRLTLLAVLLMVLVASAVASAYVVTRPDADDVQAEREQVLDVASQFMLRVNTYGPDLLDEGGQMPAYRDLVGELITPKFKADFDQQVGTAEQIVSQAQLARTCEVYGVGVSSMDSDSAVALVAGSYTNTYPGSGKNAETRVEDDPASFRVRVDLVKVAGEWLVDDFAPATGEGVTLDPGAQQTDQPTEGAS